MTGRYIETLLESEHTGQHTVTLLRLLAEAKAQSHDWIGCIEVLDGFSKAATSLAIAYLDLTNLVLGTAYFTVTYEVAVVTPVLARFERALHSAMHTEHAGWPVSAALTGARLLVYQAFLAVTEGQFARALAHWELVDERDLSEAQAGKHIGPRSYTT